MGENNPARLDEPGAPILETFQVSDGYRFYYRHYAPAGRPRAAVVFLHGIQSHGGWYGGTCAALKDAGFAVYFLDRRGAGLNTAHRGDAPNFRRLLDDVGEFVKLGPPAVSPELPRFLVAISWGGKLGVGVQYRYPGLVDGLALLCPGFFPQVRPNIRTRVSVARARLRNPGKFFRIPLNEPELFTASPRWQGFIARDRYGLREATARLMVESISLDIYLRRAWKWVRVPVLLMLAGRDRVIDNPKTRAYVEKFPSADKQVIEYPEAHHTLEFEPDPGVYRRDLLHWLERHLT
ncbi:MAG TPA: alpha/beta fold hydrolase [Gemmataceae bacterium]